MLQVGYNFFEMEGDRGKSHHKKGENMEMPGSR